MQINNYFQKNANMSMVAQLLWRHPGISRIEIAKKLGVYRSTISNIINAMIHNGVVLESKESGNGVSGGRKPLHLELNPDFGCVIGLELQPSGYTAVVTDFTGSILMSRTGDLPEGSFETIPARIMEILEDAVRSTGLSPLAVCVGMPGIIDSEHSVVLRSDIFNVHTVAFPQAAGARFGVPVYIENEANCLAWHELLGTREKEHCSLLCVNTEYTRDASRFSPCNGLAVGIGVALNGRVYAGSKHAAGEFVSIRWNGDMVGQGNFSVPEEGLPETGGIAEQWIRDLFESLIPVITVFDPHAVIIHGEFARHRETVESVLKRDVPLFDALLKRTGCLLRFSDGDRRSVALGAAHMFLMRLFSITAGDVAVSTRDADGFRLVSWDSLFQKHVS